MAKETIMDLLTYLERDCAGADRYEFWTEAGEPDLIAARAFAEQMRSRLGGFLHDFVEVEQRVNVVTLLALTHDAACESPVT